jgi:hypothetical protein
VHRHPALLVRRLRRSVVTPSVKIFLPVSHHRPATGRAMMGAPHVNRRTWLHQCIQYRTPRGWPSGLWDSVSQAGKLLRLGPIAGQLHL